jgi:HK97 family phage major capsid protein
MDENKEVEMTIPQLQEMINKTIETNGKKAAVEAIEEFKGAALQAEMKKIYPHFGEEGDMTSGRLKSRSGSVIDASALRQGTHTQSDAEFASSLVSIGGVFKKLSPAMEQWGRLLKCTGNSMALKRFDYTALENAIKDEYKAFGMKTDSIADAMAEGNTGYGNYLVPVEFPSMIVEAAIRNSPLLSQIWRLPMNGPIVQIPKLTQSDGSYFGGITFNEIGGNTWVDGAIANTAEGQKITPTKAAIERNVLLAKKITAGVILTDEIIQDSVLNIVNYMTGLLVRAWQYRMEYYVIQGNGTSMPLGIINDATVIANALPRKTANQLSHEDIIGLDGELDEIFSGSEMWLMRKKTLANLRLKKDSVGQPIVRESWGERMGQPTLAPAVLGHPYHVTKNVPALGTTGDVVIGNMGMYIMGIRSDMRIDISDAPRFEYDETNVRFVARLDGRPGTSFAFKMLKGATS